MASVRITVTIDNRLLKRVDRLIQDARFPSRSAVVESALAEKLARIDGFARESGKLNKREERRLAEYGLAMDLAEWPEFPSTVSRKLAALRKAARHRFPAPPITEMLSEIRRGYVDGNDEA